MSSPSPHLGRDSVRELLARIHDWSDNHQVAGALVHVLRDAFPDVHVSVLCYDPSAHVVRVVATSQPAAEAYAASCREHVEYLHSLLETGNHLRLQLHPQQVLREICTAIRETLGWEYVIISLRDYEAGTSRPVAAAGFDESTQQEILGIEPVAIERAADKFRPEFRVSNSYFLPYPEAERYEPDHLFHVAESRPTRPAE